jgi:hypothetical protein
MKKPRKPIPRYTQPKRTPVRTRRTTPRRRAGACRPYLDWLKTQPCRVTGRWTTDLYGALVDPAHVRTKRLGGDLWNAISLSRAAHEEQHQVGIPAFEAKYGVSMKALAIAQTEEFLTLYPQYRESA